MADDCPLLQQRSKHGPESGRRGPYAAERRCFVGSTRMRPPRRCFSTRYSEPCVCLRARFRPKSVSDTQTTRSLLVAERDCFEEKPLILKQAGVLINSCWTRCIAMQRDNGDKNWFGRGLTIFFSVFDRHVRCNLYLSIFKFKIT